MVRVFCFIYLLSPPFLTLLRYNFDFVCCMLYLSIVDTHSHGMEAIGITQ